MFMALFGGGAMCRHARFYLINLKHVIISNYCRNNFMKFNQHLQTLFPQNAVEVKFIALIEVQRICIIWLKTKLDPFHESLALVK